MDAPSPEEASRLFAAIRAHPRLDEAIRHASQGALDLAGEATPLARLYRDYGTYMLMTVALSQHFTPEGLTVGRLQAISAELGLASRGRTDALIGQLLDRGGLAEGPGAGDRRLHVLAPTQALLAFMRDRIHVDVLAATMVSRPAAEMAAGFDDPAFTPSYFRAMGEALKRSRRRIGELGGDLGPFGDRNAGLTILNDIIVRLSALDPSEEASVSVAAWSSRFGVSRSHVLKMLRDAHEAGRIVWRPDARRLSLTAEHIHAMRAFFAFIFLGMTFALAQALGGRSIAP